MLVVYFSRWFVFSVCFVVAFIGFVAFLLVDCVLCLTLFVCGDLNGVLLVWVYSLVELVKFLAWWFAVVDAYLDWCVVCAGCFVYVMDVYVEGFVVCKFCVFVGFG